MWGRMGAPDDVALSIQSFRPRPTDIIISPFSKCGTTWLQQIFHCLRTGGDMDFDDISRVTPWIEMARALGIDLNSPQKAQPRGSRATGLGRHPKGARYMVCLRDPKDAFVSLYRFMEGWFLEPGPSLLTSSPGPGSPTARCAELLASPDQLVGERDNSDLLLMSYEHMREAPALHIEKIAAFAAYRSATPCLS